MASDEEHRRGLNAAPPPAPYNGAHFDISSHPTLAPSYYSGHSTSSPRPPYGAPQGQPPRAGTSPFESVFDDPAYPHNHGSYPSGGMHQHGLHHDTGYYSQGGTPSPQPQAPEDIPLRDHNPPQNMDSNDHIYDAAAGSDGRHPAKGRRKVLLGELGMFGADRKRIPFVVYTLTAIQVAVFIAEIVKNGILTRSPIMTKPQFNPMIGPSAQVMINMGARYVPCMHNVKEIQGSSVPVLFLCPNATTADNFCSLSELCGFGGVPNPTFNNFDQSPRPDQWFRFITPIFMHAGLIHIGFNLLLQMTIAKEMEVAIGPIRFFLVYMSAGIFGFVLGGNFAAPAEPSTGASGSLFGIIALTLLDLLYSWKERKSPVKDLMFLLLDMVISFALGLLPGLDNFAHIGGFLMGLGLGICVLHSPNALRKRMGNGHPYSIFVAGDGSPAAQFLKGPLGFFKGRKPFWWFWWIIRAALLIVVIIVSIVLINNFYTMRDRCRWCKYLSCIPVSNWCEVGTIREQS